LVDSLIDKTFNRLTVIAYAGKKGKNNAKYWTCQCSCDNKTIKDIRQDALKSGSIKSCGCLHKGYDKNIIYKEFVRENICDHCGATEGKFVHSKKYGMNLCKRHYKQLVELGKFIDNNQRSQKDKNEIVKYQTCAEIFLYDKNGNLIVKTLIDLEDIDKCSKYKWGIDGNGYVRTDIGNSRVLLHRYILEAPKSKLVDHINLNTLDNRKSNLRLVTKQQNQMNQANRKGSKSNFKGVYWDKNRNKWYAELTHKGIKYRLGHFIDIEDAKKARKDAEIFYQGEYRYKGNE